MNDVWGELTVIYQHHSCGWSSSKAMSSDSKGLLRMTLNHSCEIFLRLHRHVSLGSFFSICCLVFRLNLDDPQFYLSGKTWEAVVWHVAVVWYCLFVYGTAIECSWNWPRFNQCVVCFYVYYQEVLVVYRTAAKYSNKSVFQYCLNEECRITSWKDLVPQRAHDQGASNTTFGWRIWYH